MRLPIINTPRGTYISVIIRSDEFNPDFPMQFILDTGAEDTTISASHLYFHDGQMDFSKLKSKDVVGVCGVCKIYLINNVTLYFFSDNEEWFIGGSFKEVGIIPPKYKPITGQLISIPSIIGLDLIGKNYTFHYGKEEVYFEY